MIRSGIPEALVEFVKEVENTRLEYTPPFYVVIGNIFEGFIKEALIEADHNDRLVVNIVSEEGKKYRFSYVNYMLKIITQMHLNKAHIYSEQAQVEADANKLKYIDEAMF